MSESAPPKYVYKIIPQKPPSPLPRDLPLSQLDQADGFIHMSTAQQVPGTLNRFFIPARTLWIMRIPYERVASRTKWENTFPHLYGGEFGSEEVESVEEFARTDEEEGWDAAVGRKGEWLL